MNSVNAGGTDGATDASGNVAWAATAATGEFIGQRSDHGLVAATGELAAQSVNGTGLNHHRSRHQALASRCKLLFPFFCKKKKLRM